MRKILFLSFAVTMFLSAGAAFAVNTGQSTDVTATVPQAVMQNTTPVPNGQTPGGGTAATLGPDGKPVPVITSTPGATEAQFGGDPNEVICRDSQAVTGTIFKTKVCHTRREWADAENLSQQIMRNIHKGPAQCRDTSCGKSTP